MPQQAAFWPAASGRARGRPWAVLASGGVPPRRCTVTAYVPMVGCAGGARPACSCTTALDSKTGRVRRNAGGAAPTLELPRRAWWPVPQDTPRSGAGDTVIRLDEDEGKGEAISCKRTHRRTCAAAVPTSELHCTAHLQPRLLLLPARVAASQREVDGQQRPPGQAQTACLRVGGLACSACSARWAR